jgi:hydrogenase nickel incorporation protein HypA/HybF
MHELSIIQNIITILENEAQKHRLKNINKFVLQIGKLRQIIPEFLQFAFSVAAKNTIAEKAIMVIEEIPIEASCQICQHKFSIENNNYLCPICKNNSNILSGNEIILTTMEGETDV